MCTHPRSQELAQLYDAGKLQNTVTKTWHPINAANLRAAHELVESGGAVGKATLYGWE
jgi:hypothetical protein